MKVTYGVATKAAALALVAAGAAVPFALGACSSSDPADGGDGGTAGGALDGAADSPAPVPDTGSTAAPSCDEYCEPALESCPASGPSRQYATKAQCLAACAHLPPGQGGAIDGNSVACRAYHAGVAGQPGQDTVHCPHAGYSGAATCGSRCEAFCQVAVGHCKAPLPQPFASVSACLAACGQDGGFRDFDPGAPGGEYPTTGLTQNNLNCRQGRLWQALEDTDGGDAGAAFNECARIGLPGVTDGGLTPACVN